jgi:hypothetical protein
VRGGLAIKISFRRIRPCPPPSLSMRSLGRGPWWECAQVVQAQTLARLQAEPWPRTDTMDVSGNAMQLPPTHDDGTVRAALICTLFRANAQVGASVCLRACWPALTAAMRKCNTIYLAGCTSSRTVAALGRRGEWCAGPHCQRREGWKLVNHDGVTTWEGAGCLQNCAALPCQCIPRRSGALVLSTRRQECNN